MDLSKEGMHLRMEVGVGGLSLSMLVITYEEKAKSKFAVTTIYE